MAGEGFLKAQVGLQTAHGTPVTPTIQVPWTVDYEDTREIHTAEYDAGTWTPTTIVAQVATSARVTIKGTAMFEMLPVLWNSGYADVAPAGTYTHTYTIAPGAVGAPMPLSWEIGAVGASLGATGPAVKISDAYLESWTLSGNMNDKTITLEGEFFASTFDPGTGSNGYAFTASLVLPTGCEIMKYLGGQINVKDAGATGGSFTAMTALSGVVMDWKLTGKTGLKPKYSGDGNTTTFGGVTYEKPSLEYTPTLRTTTATVANILAKWTARTYQELQIVINGSAATEKLTANLTGRWTAVPTVHARENGEVVIKPTFTAQTPHTQVTTPHWAALIVASAHNWT